MFVGSKSIPDIRFSDADVDIRKTSRSVPFATDALERKAEKPHVRERAASLSLHLKDLDSSTDGEIPLREYKIRKVKKRRKPKSNSLIDKRRSLLKSSLKAIDQIRNAPNHPESPRLRQKVQENLSEYCQSHSSPLREEEINELNAHHQLQIDKLKKKLASKEREICSLKKEVKRNKKRDSKAECELHTEIMLDSRLNHLDQEVALLKSHFKQTTLMKKKLDKLFELDSEDEQKSIENFYYLVLNKLTAFTIAIQGLNSGLVARSTSWKDDLVAQVFIYLNNISQGVGGAASFFFGAGVIIPLVALPFLASSELAWEKYRDSCKEAEFKHAAMNLSGGLAAIEERNRNIAYSLTSLLRMQLRYCTFAGAEKIVEDWVYRFCYNLMKGSSNEKESLNTIDTILPHIFNSKQKKQTIETHANRKWSTTGLFEKTGVAYPCVDEIRYESLFQYHNKHKQYKCKSKAEKYGYLFFNTIEEATSYKQSLIETHLRKGEKISYTWRKDPQPIGPKILVEDANHLRLSNSMIEVIPIDQTRQRYSLSDETAYPPFSPILQRLREEKNETLEELKKDNERLKKEKRSLERKNSQFEVTIATIEQQMRSLLSPEHEEPEPSSEEE